MLSDALNVHLNKHNLEELKKVISVQIFLLTIHAKNIAALIVEKHPGFQSIR